MKQLTKLFACLLALTLLLTGTQVFAAEAAVSQPGVVAPEDRVQWGQDVVKAASEMVFPTDGSDAKLPCPICGETVTWYAWELYNENNSDPDRRYLNNIHIFLIGDMTGIEDIFDRTINIDGFVFQSRKSNEHSVIHLNGYAINGPQAGVYARGGELNIIGEGTVRGHRENSKFGSNLHIDNGGTLNIFGGTYDKTKALPLLRITEGSTCNFYGGTLMGNDFLTGGTVRVVEDGTFNMYGGTIETGYSSAQGDTVYVELGKANIHGGTILGGRGAQGGNITADAGELNITGGNINGAILAPGATVTVTGGNFDSTLTGPLINITGGTFTLDMTEYMDEGYVCSEKDGSFTVQTVQEQKSEAFPVELILPIGGGVLAVVVAVVVILLLSKKKKPQDEESQNPQQQNEE